MSLQNGADLVVQLERSGTIECRAYTGLSLGAAAYIAIVTAPSSVAELNGAALRDGLLRELTAAAPGFVSVPAPCGGSVPSLAACHAHGVVDCVKLLVVIGDDATPIGLRPEYAAWLQNAQYRVLPVFPASARRRVSSLLPATIRAINAAFWTATIEECVPRILQSAGLVDERSRVFISYRQADYPGVAIQLFDALAHRNFDVFLDSFRIEPGVDFQQRLTEGLADKSVILVIESPTILDSEWTRFEAICAKKYGLGLIGLLPPRGTCVPEIDEDRRVRLSDGDFTQVPLTNAAQLTERALVHVADEVSRQHARIMLWRRQEVRESVMLALQDAGLHVQPAGPDIAVQTGSQQYLISYSTRPPDSLDFERTGSIANIGSARGVLVGLCSLMQRTTRRHVDWLAGVSGVTIVDEGLVMSAARAIAGGSL